MINFNTEESVKGSSASSIKIFENADFGKVRVCLLDNEPWFAGNDIASILGYKSPKDSIRYNVPENHKRLIQLSDFQEGVTATPPDNTKGSKIIVIDEAGLYRLVMRSQMPNAEPFVEWVTSEVLPTIRKTGSYSISKREPVVFAEDERMVWQARMREFDIRELEAKNESARIMLSIKEKTSIPEVAAIADAYATNLLVGKEVVALPETKEKTYSATEIGKMLGVSSAKIGRLSNIHNLKTEEYGKWFFDKSRHSNKEVESFRYYGKAIDVFRKLLS